MDTTIWHRRVVVSVLSAFEAFHGCRLGYLWKCFVNLIFQRMTIVACSMSSGTVTPNGSRVHGLIHEPLRFAAYIFYGLYFLIYPQHSIVVGKCCTHKILKNYQQKKDIDIGGTFTPVRVHVPEDS